MKRYFETQRLLVRDWSDADVDAWADMNADDRVMEFFPATIPRERSIASGNALRDELQRDGYGWFVVEVKDGLRFAGCIALAPVLYEMPFTPANEIGWRFVAPAWGKGYATEAAAAALVYAKDVLGWPPVVAFTAAINKRSRRVMEKLGMTHDLAEDFEHPRLEPGHRLRPHVLYRAL